MKIEFNEIALKQHKHHNLYVCEDIFSYENLAGGLKIKNKISI